VEIVARNGASFKTAYLSAGFAEWVIPNFIERRDYIQRCVRFKSPHFAYAGANDGSAFTLLQATRMGLESGPHFASIRRFPLLSRRRFLEQTSCVVGSAVLANSVLAGVSAGATAPLPAAPDADLLARAKALLLQAPLIDTHNDLPSMFLETKAGDLTSFDMNKVQPTLCADIPRLREGCVGAQYWSIFVESSTQKTHTSLHEALREFDVAQRFISSRPELEQARTADDIGRIHQSGRIACLLGVEGGHMIGNDIHVLRIFADLGVRYVTLTHFYNDEWADSSTAKPEHNGLTDFGKEVVREMNRQGILVDISHVSDKTFYDALAVSQAPLIASHSSCRALCDHVRDMSDDMIKALAAKGGVIQINYEKSFIDQAYKDASDKARGNVTAMFDALAKECNNDDACLNKKMNEEEKKLTAEGKLPHVSWERIVDHIDHAVKLVGADHVGLGSDFDGATMPEGLEDASKLPKITEALLRKGYSDEDIRKILGGNTLRIMEQAERVSRAMQAQQ